LLDWNSNPILNPDTTRAIVNGGEQESQPRPVLDNQNTLAWPIMPRFMVDEQKWTQANRKIQLALKQDPSLMDVHRVDAVCQRKEGNDNDSINEYIKAAAITPT